MKKRKWNAYDLANKSNVPQPTIHRFLSGEHGDPRGTTIAKLAAGLGISEAQLRGFTTHTNEENPSYTITKIEPWDNETQLRNDEVELPFFREVELSAGSGSHQVIENHGCKLRFSKSTLKRKNVDPNHAACVMVSGESMQPVLPDGCTVGIDTNNTTIKNGDMYAIDHCGELRVKVLYRLVSNGVRIKSYNEEYPDEIYNADEAQNIKILGRVFWCSWLI